jgi:hypothetical protein
MLPKPTCYTAACDQVSIVGSETPSLYGNTRPGLTEATEKVIVYIATALFLCFSSLALSLCLVCNLKVSFVFFTMLLLQIRYGILVAMLTFFHLYVSLYLLYNPMQL